jgi:hypothetical protein
MTRLKSLGCISLLVLQGASFAEDDGAECVAAVDAQISLGCLPEAEDEAMDFLCTEGIGSDFRPYMLALWLSTRTLQGKAVEDDRLDAALSILPPDEPMVRLYRFLEEELCGQAALGVESIEGASVIPLEQVDCCKGGVPVAHVLTVAVNDRGSRAIVDTGAWTTTLAEKVAREASVAIGPQLIQLSRSGVIVKTSLGFVRQLEIGSVRLRNLPVIVTNDPVLASNEVALGVDLMHRLRFTLDYPRRTLTVAPATGIVPEEQPDGAWDIPLSLFREEQLTLEASRDVPLFAFRASLVAPGALPGGIAVTVVIDTGNYSGSLVRGPWASVHVPGYVPSAKPRGDPAAFETEDPGEYRLRNFTLAGASLPDWPLTVVRPGWRADDRGPDVIFGYDLLQRCRVIVDTRSLRLDFAHHQAPGSAERGILQWATLAGAGAWWSCGRRFVEQRRYADSLRCFDEAIRLDAAFGEPWISKCEALVQLDRTEEALQCAGRAAVLSPDNSRAWVWKACVLRRLQRPALARKAMEEAATRAGAVAWEQLAEIEGLHLPTETR